MIFLGICNSKRDELHQRSKGFFADKQTPRCIFLGILFLEFTSPLILFDSIKMEIRKEGMQWKRIFLHPFRSRLFSHSIPWRMWHEDQVKERRKKIFMWDQASINSVGNKTGSLKSICLWVMTVTKNHPFDDGYKRRNRRTIKRNFFRWRKKKKRETCNPEDIRICLWQTRNSPQVLSLSHQITSNRIKNKKIKNSKETF